MTAPAKGKRRSRAMDPDVRILKTVCRTLLRSSRSRMLYANLSYLWDRFLVNPSPEVKARFWPDQYGELPGRSGPGGKP